MYLETIIVRNSIGTKPERILFVADAYHNYIMIK